VAAPGGTEVDMRIDDAQQVRTVIEECVVDASGQERRRALRRRLPFGRGAVLLVGERPHIVGLADLSVGGAFLRTSATAIVAVGERHVLRLLLLPDRTEFEIQAEVVRVVESQESDDHPRGVAVRFLDTDEPLRQKILAFIERGILLQA
jgi:hypothetical protein